MLGCANIAWRRTLPAFAESSTATVVAAASRDPHKAERFAVRFGCAPVVGYSALLEREDVDAVYLPLPTGLHARWAADALRAGKHVLAEKPLATTASEATELISLAEQRDLVLMENRMFSYHTQHEEVRKLVANGELGELRTLHATMTIPPLPEDDPRYRAELGGGALLDVGFYPLHAALLLLTEPLEVLGADLHRHPERGVDVRGAVLLRDANGVTAHLTFGIEHSYRAAYELSGSQARLVLERAFTPPPSWQPVLRIEAQDRSECRTLPASPQFLNSVNAFTAAVLDRTRPRDHLRTTLRGLELMDTVRAYDHKGRS
ncbi:NDP-hexose-3-ketoreductase [Kutzneria viridogrisea]|uniref:NDP-hexose-3-ketoreductase n=1 Tax=Kutzneria viridogrisea TaxID=47990 RepID=A0ABR6BAG1_9PSEU|nr:NDP-hexose-3-ketoreductase [Kutzneria viridogrisea]